jgi:hypothetical protein
MDNSLRNPSLENPLSKFPRTYEYQLASFANYPGTYEYEGAAFNNYPDSFEYDIGSFSNFPTTYEYQIAAFSNLPSAWLYLGSETFVEAEAFLYEPVTDYDREFEWYAWEYIEATNPMVFPSYRYDEIIYNNEMVRSIRYESVEKTQFPVLVQRYEDAVR